MQNAVLDVTYDPPPSQGQGIDLGPQVHPSGGRKLLVPASEQQCENGGIKYQGKCMCPLHTDSYCDEGMPLQAYSFKYVCVGNCPKLLDNHYEMLEEWTSKPWKGNETSCEISPEYFCCWKGMYLKSNVSSVPLPDSVAAPSPAEMENIYARYGPWTDTDKLMLRYLVGDLRYTPPLESKVPDTPRLAFVIMGHGAFDRLGKMLDAMYSPRHIYLLHIDAKCNSWEVEYAEYFVQQYNKNKNVTNVYIMGNRFHGRWGGVSLVYQELAAINELLRLSKEDPWTHVINLSLYDYPVKPLAYIEKFLFEHQNMTFIDLNPGIREMRHKVLTLFADCMHLTLRRTYIFLVGLIWSC